MKKKLMIMLLMLTTLTLVGCDIQRRPNINTEENRTISTNYTNMSEEYLISDSEIDLYYYKDSVIPFVEISSFINLLDGLYYSDEFEYLENFDQGILTLSLEYIEDDTVYTYQMELDANLDTIYVETLDFFYIYIQQPETNYGEGLIDLEPRITKGKSVTYNLAEYEMDLIIEDDMFLLPLAVANLILNQSVYFDVYFNGETLYGIDTAYISDAELKTVMKSDFNNTLAPDEILSYNYNFYKFVIDYFYGLKDERNITTGELFIKKEDYLSKDSSVAVFDVTNALDDLHSSFIARGYYNNRRQTVNDYYADPISGGYIDSFYQGLDAVQQQALTYFGITTTGYLNIPEFEYIDNDKTLIIYLMGFDIDTPVIVEDILANAKSTTENVIIDLSLNTGGNLGAVLRMFTLMSNKEVWYHMIDPLSMEKVSYGVLGDKEPFLNYNYFIKQSSVTFSAANLTAAIANELGIKTIGQKSGGGASSIDFILFPDGSIINISSNTVLTNKDYQSIEYGVVPDIHLDNLYSESEIISKIN